MADKETGLNITVGAVADENSAAQAAKDLTKGVLSSLKDGYIEVPAEIKVPIKGASKELEQAQKKVLTQWRKTFKKGFSSSEEDLNELTKAYKKFKELSKGKAKEEQSKWITNVIGKQIASYKRQLTKQTRETKRAEQIAKLEQAKQRKVQIKSKKPKDGFSEDVIKRAKDAWTKEIKDREKAYKELSEPGPNRLGSTSPKGFKTNSGIDQGRTSEYELKRSELSSYPSGTARQIRQSEKESQKWMKKSLTVSKPGSEAIEQAIENARKTGRNKNRFSPQEKALGLSDTIRSNILPDLLNKIKTSDDDTEIDKLKQEFLDTLETISKLNTDAGKLILDDVKKTIGITMGSLGFTTSGNIGGTEGDKEDLSKDPKMVSLLKDLFSGIAEKEELIKQELIKLEQLEKNSGSKSKTEKVVNNLANRMIAETRIGKVAQAQNSKHLEQAVTKNQKATETQTAYDKIENSAERVADSTEGKKTDELIKDASDDLNSGFNTDSNANNAVSKIEDLGTILKDILGSILIEVQSITKNGVNITGVQKGQTNTRSNPSLLPVPAQPKMQQALAMAQYVAKYGKSQAVSGDISSSKITTTVKNPHSWVTKLRDAFTDLTGVTTNYKVIMAKTSEEQNKMAADRIRRYGISRGNNATDTGDKTMIARRLSLFRNKDYFKTLFKDINLSEGIKIDTTDVTDKLAKALSGREMFNAQTGGWLKNILGAMTGGVAFAFQPSLEKSRSRVEGVNQIMANIRKVLNDTVQDIQDKESKLRGMKASGDLKLDAKGNVLESSSTEAKTLVLQLQESKDALNSILADTKYVDEVVSKTHGRINGIIRQLGFTSQPLRKNNVILANLNAGLDKSGKALKYHNRLAEILGYSFRLISRHVGQMFKNLLLSLSPINLIKKAFQGIKGLFQDFMGYNTKWQRTMNVVKYNLHSILEPFMDKIAQFLVNCIGFVDIISMKVQEAFGSIPISLFDQAAADARKIHEELEAGADVSAGFDELHDIGSNNTGANDLLGEIYKPQLSQDWIDLANKIGDLFAGLIKGDLGFGDVAKAIWDILTDLGKKIWDWFKTTDLGKWFDDTFNWIANNWQHLLWTLLNIFVGWKLLKIAGGLIWNALTGKLTAGAFTGLLGNIFGWISSGLNSIFTSGGLIGAFKSGAASLGTIFGEVFLATAGVAIISWGYSKGGKMAQDDAAYNMGLLASGGNKKDMKNYAGANAVSAGTGAIGGAIAGFGIAGLPGAIIGAFAGGAGGLANNNLAIALEQIENSAKKAKGELQEVSYYEGELKGATTQVEQWNEIMQLANDTLGKQTDKIYTQGEKLGISKTRLDQLVESTKNGTFHTGMLSGAESQLADDLSQLSNIQEQTTKTSEKLAEAKKKMAQAETDVAIAKDIEAGNFELAESRIELAYASEIFTAEEANKRIASILQKGNEEQKKYILDNMSDDLKKNWDEQVQVIQDAVNNIFHIYQELDNEASDIFSKDHSAEARDSLQRTFDEMRKTINSSNVWDNLAASVSFGIQLTSSANSTKVASFDIGTNYVPNDGLAYLHEGEAVIPKKYNQPYQQSMSGEEKAYMQQIMTTMRSLDSTMKQGIPVTGQFTQRGSDLVAVVNRTNSQTGADLLSNVAYAR